jgi:hypothetical protein
LKLYSALVINAIYLWNQDVRIIRIVSRTK